MKRICAITMARNDDFFLERWIEYYGLQLGKENLYILLDGTDQKIPQNAGYSNVSHYERVDGQVAAADRGRIHLISNKASELLKKYDLVIGADVDEFLMVDPRCRKTLLEYLSQLKIRTSVSGLGIDVGQKLGEESKVNPQLPLLSQRQYALVSSRYTKASVIAAPVEWGSGFHRIRNHNYSIDRNLYLFHFGCVDMEMLEQKLKDNDKLLTGWERHLKKRTKTIELVTRKTARNADTYLPLARIFQTIFRPVFAWNKPTMACWKLVVKIPERFGNQSLC